MGRLFRFGGSSASSDNASPSSPEVRRTPYSSDAGASNGFTSLASYPAFGAPCSGNATYPRRRATPPVRQLGRPAAVAQPRVSTAVTNADPVLTRFALGRSNDGSQFGMLLQIFTDGTVIDSEGVHAFGRPICRPIVDGAVG